MDYSKVKRLFALVSFLKKRSLREKCPYPELFWFAFSRFQTKYGEILRISSYSARMWEHAVQNNYKYGHFLSNGKL